MTAYPDQATREAATIARVEADLLSGRYFRLIANSHNSVPKGGPPVTSGGWAKAMEAVAKYAQMGDRAAATAAQVFGKINLYATTNEVVAQVATRLAEVAATDYYDVIRATGPEPGRPSSHTHPTDLRSALYLALLMTEVRVVVGYHGSAPGIGWVVQHLVERENLPVYACYLPNVAKMLGK